MAQLELDDSADALQAKDTERRVPPGIWALFAGLVLWGVYYLAAYMGWDQAADVSGNGAALGANVTHTIAYTAIPAAVIVALAIAMSRRTGPRRR